jgi:hypothetical protein
MKRIISRFVAWPSALVLALLLFLAQPRMAKADDVQVIVCTVADFVCPVANTFANEGFLYTPGNLLLPNTYTIQNVNLGGPGFLDPDNFFNSFSATYVTADVAGKWIYLWGTATVSMKQDLADEAKLLGVANLYVDVALRQNYVTAAGTWAFNEGLSGNCDMNAMAGAGVAFQGQVNGANLPVIGAPGDCAASPFSFTNGPTLQGLGKVTQLIGGIEYQFSAAGNYPETITLPFGSEFPDPAINFNDPNNPLNFITNADIPADLTLVANAPEPASWMLLASALGAIALLTKARRVGGNKHGLGTARRILS